MRVGVLSDTHGLLRPEVIEALAGVDLILHAGDVGGAGVLERLGALAPVTAVSGNVDGGALRRHLPRVAEVSVGGLVFVVTHGDRFGSPAPRQLREAYPRADAIVFGHTHRVEISDPGDAAMVVNPGTAGPARCGNAPSVAIVEVEPGRRPRARIVMLGGGGVRGKKGP